MARTKKKKRAPSAWNKVAGASMKACRIEAGDSSSKFGKCLSTRLKAAAKGYNAPNRPRKKGGGKKR